MKPRVLWIEDSARLELRNYTGPIYFNGDYDFSQADDITSAVSFLRVRPYDVVIVDIRLLPGNDPVWTHLYHQAGQDKVQAQLGLKFLHWILGNSDGMGIQPPAGIKATQIGVFTVENYLDIQNDLNSLGVKVFKQKSAGLPDTILVELIEKVLAQVTGGD
jgi:hypothetical protein